VAAQFPKQPAIPEDIMQQHKRNIALDQAIALAPRTLSLALASRTLFLALALAIPAALLTGCVTAPVVPPLAGIYTNIEAPLDLNSAGGKTIGPKRGEASTIAVLGLLAVGDAGVKAAAQQGGIVRVNHLDYHFRSYLFGAFARYTTVAYGE
jgi:hypothetical protein